MTQGPNPEPEQGESADSDPERVRPHSEPSLVDEPAPEDRDIGWGDYNDGDGRSDEWYRRERPPHHG